MKTKTSRSPSPHAHTVAIVDAYSSGIDIAPAFQQAGCQCVHIQSRNNLPEKLLHSYRPDCFVEQLTYSNTPGFWHHLEELSITAVVTGCETGTMLTDLLAMKLTLPGNDFASSQVRRNKLAMQMQLKLAGLKHIPSTCVSSIAEIEQYGPELLEYSGRVVLKPVESSGTDGVSVCADMNQLRHAFNMLFGADNQLNLPNSEVLLQPYIVGEEYVVDTVSMHGRHRLCAIWKMGKGQHNGGSAVCEFTELISLPDAQLAELQNYVFKCLDVLGIHYGAGHSELFLTARGWVLIETGARIHGAGFPVLSRDALAQTQIDALVQCYLDPDLFMAALSRPYRPLKALKIKELIAYQSGNLKAVRAVSDIRARETFLACQLPEQGTRISITRDVFTSPGWVALCHDDPEEVENDYQWLTQLEQRGMFDFVP
ncbi:ATP-grasp domain-containing protein [Gynuella sp.]|uniref:ATP-grasp domain-containing protein n=1 Tax=Gynuella sp. TaxID=2969146 RepID=UPI003D14E76F